MNFAMATYLRFERKGKIPSGSREKNLPSWLSQFSFAKLRQPIGQTFFPIFPKEFSHFLQTIDSHSWVLLENAKKTWYSILGVDAMPLFLKNLLLENSVRIPKPFFPVRIHKFRYDDELYRFFYSNNNTIFKISGYLVSLICF